MKPFEINPECSKCGSHNIKLNYRLFDPSDFIGWLDVTCNICGHRWDMQTKDDSRKFDKGKPEAK